MRVAQVVADGRPGGGTVMVLALIEELLRIGHEACLVTDAGSPAAEEATRLGARVETLPFFSPLSATRNVGAALDRLAPEVLHAHGSRAGFHVAPWLTGRPGVAAHYTVHGYHFHHRRWPRNWIGRWLERRTGPRFASVVHVCEHDRGVADRWRLVTAGSESQVIYNGVAVEALPEPAPEELPRAAFVGRLVPQKDPRLITAIAKRLAGDGIAVSIVGGGPLELEVRRSLEPELAAGDVVLTGEVDHRGALTELSRASVLVLPSRWEGLPVVLLEALAMGVPAVAARVGGVPEVVVDGECGVLVNDRAPESYAAAVRRLLAEPDRRRSLGERGRTRVREHFTLDAFLRASLQLYGL